MTDPTQPPVAELHPHTFFKLQKPCHPQGNYYVTGKVEKRLFPWQQPQPGERRREKVGWTLEHDGHWEVEVACGTCTKRHWSLSERARAAILAFLLAQDKPIPDGLQVSPAPAPDSPDSREAQEAAVARAAARQE